MRLITDRMTVWYLNNNLLLDTRKTKDVIVDYRMSRKTEHAPRLIQGEAVEHVQNIKFLGIHITSELTWSVNTAHWETKAQQGLFFPGKLKRAGPSCRLLTNFYRTTKDPILCLGMTVWYGGSTAQDSKDLARVVRTAQWIVGDPLPDLVSLYGFKGELTGSLQILSIVAMDFLYLSPRRKVQKHQTYSQD